MDIKNINRRIKNFFHQYKYINDDVQLRNFLLNFFGKDFVNYCQPQKFSVLFTTVP